MRNQRASQIALGFVVLVVAVAFVWWSRERPSYLLYKAHKGVGELGQAAAIAEFRKVLKSKNLSREDEAKHRLELGVLYLRALEESRGLSRYVLTDPDQPAHPFLADAKKEFDRVLELDPDNARAHPRLGQIYWLTNLETYAIEELERGRKKNPTDPEAFRYLAAVYLERGDTGKARDLALQALSINPAYDEARMVLIDAYSQAGETGNALNEYERLSSGHKDVPHVRAQHGLLLAAQNYWSESDQEMEAALRSAPNSGAIKIMYGQLLTERGLYDAAIGAFAQAQDLLPRNVWPLLWKSQVHSLRGQCEETSRVGQMLSSAWPRWSWARLVEAWAALCRANDEKAVSELTEALRLSPDFAEAHRLRARIFLERGQFERLGQAVRPMLDQKLLEGEAHVLLALSLLEQGKTALATEMAESAIRLNLRHEEAFAALAEARAESGDAAGAARAFESALELNPRNAEVRSRHLRFMARTGQAVLADRAFKDLVVEAAYDPAVWLYWGEVQIIRGAWADAVASFQNALANKPHLMRAHLGLVEAYARQRQDGSASRALQRANELNPRHPQLQALRRRYQS